MSFNPDYMKPVHKVVFGRKISKNHQDYDYGAVGNDKVFKESFHKKL